MKSEPETDTESIMSKS